MGLLMFLKRFVISNVLSLCYAGTTLFVFLLNYLKNPFSDPWAQKLRLEPPSCLTDPKYGVHKYLICNNTKLHYVESGNPSKPLMLFLHGFPEFWYSWRYQITEFNKDYWCIAIDMRGYGDSEKPDDINSYKIDCLVEDIRDMVRNLGRDKCTLVAHDWGSIVACRFRDVYPDVLHALVVLGGVSREAWFSEVWSNGEQLKMAWYIFLFRWPWIPERLIQMNDLAAFDQFMIMKDKGSIEKQDVECYKYWFGKPLALTPPINYYRANFAYSVKDKKRCELPVPFLVINAAGDPYLSTKLLERLKEYYAQIETVLLENCGHFLQQEEPQRVNTLIRDFLYKNNVS